jgi:hypothetical protein
LFFHHDVCHGINNIVSDASLVLDKASISISNWLYSLFVEVAEDFPDF